MSGYSVELLSTQIDPWQLGGPGWPRLLNLRFFLPDDPEVFVTVRQLRSGSTYYWLDSVIHDWRGASVNEYAWSTETVLSHVRSLEPTGLGVVVRLREEAPGNLEEVAPAMLYASEPAAAVEGYRFTFKTNGRARVTARVYPEGGSQSVHERPTNLEKTDIPFTIRFPSADRDEGYYRLVVSSEFSSGPQTKVIRFYHKPVLQ